MTGKFFIIRVEKRRHSLSYVEYFQRRRMGNFRSGLGHIIFGLGIITFSKVPTTSTKIHVKIWAIRQNIPTFAPEFKNE
jgi:hypothetical protein